MLLPEALPWTDDGLPDPRQETVTPLANLHRDKAGILVWRRVSNDETAVSDAAPVSNNQMHTEEADSPHTPLFLQITAPLLQAPASTPLRPPASRRKTLAGPMAFPSLRRSPRLHAKNRGVPVAQMVETMLCHRMGIIGDSESATAEAINRFVQLFEGRLPPVAVSGLRALFRIDCDLSAAVENALLEHAGEEAPDLLPEAPLPEEAAASLI